MDWFTSFLKTSFLKTIKEQSPYYNMTFAIVSFFILFSPIFFSTAALDKIPEITTWRQKYLPYISIGFVFFLFLELVNLLKRL